MRVIAGKAKGRILIVPKGMETRPITSQIKEALFNIWQTQIVDASLLDLFAGSGSIGIEAISRGAKQVVFMEQSRKAVDVIKKNLAVCDFTDGYMIYRDDVFKGLMRLKEEGYTFDLIYLDPPFTAGEIFLPVMEVLSYADILDRLIDERLSQRLDQGMVEEVRQYLNAGGDPENLYRLGLEYRHITRYVNGEYASFEDFREGLSRAIKQFAKRQITWFKRDKSIHWLNMQSGHVVQASQLIDTFLFDGALNIPP